MLTKKLNLIKEKLKLNIKKTTNSSMQHIHTMLCFIRWLKKEALMVNLNLNLNMYFLI